MRLPIVAKGACGAERIGVYHSWLPATGSDGVGDGAERGAPGASNEAYPAPARLVLRVAKGSTAVGLPCAMSAAVDAWWHVIAVGDAPGAQAMSPLAIRTVVEPWCAGAGVVVAGDGVDEAVVGLTVVEASGAAPVHAVTPLSSRAATTDAGGRRSGRLRRDRSSTDPRRSTRTGARSG
jgi:hypothetical protein